MSKKGDREFHRGEGKNKLEGIEGGRKGSKKKIKKTKVKLCDLVMERRNPEEEGRRKKANERNKDGKVG